MRSQNYEAFRDLHEKKAFRILQRQRLSFHDLTINRRFSIVRSLILVLEYRSATNSAESVRWKEWKMGEEVTMLLQCRNTSSAASAIVRASSQRWFVCSSTKPS